jgi:hypothetical protein
MHDHLGRVLDFAGSTVNRRHAEAGALAATEAVGVEATERRSRTAHVAKIAPDHQLARRVPGLSLRRRRGRPSPTSLRGRSSALSL